MARTGNARDGLRLALILAPARHPEYRGTSSDLAFGSEAPEHGARSIEQCEAASLSPLARRHDVYFLRLTPVNFAFYNWLAERHVTLREQSGVHYTEVSANELLRVHASQPDISEHAVNALRIHLKQGGQIPEDLIQQRKSRVNEALTRALGQDDTPYHITGTGRIPGTQYQRQGLSRQPSAIVFAPLSLPEAADE